MNGKRTTHLTRLATTALVATLAGCLPFGLTPDDAGDESADGVGAGEMPHEELTWYSACVEEVPCARAEEACWAAQERSCSECQHAFRESSFGGECDHTCASNRCDGFTCEGTWCFEREERVAPASRDAAVFDACMAAQHRDAACSGARNDDPSACELAARRNAASVTAVYECIASTPCDGDVTPCLEILGSTDLAAHVCWALNLECGECPAEIRAHWAGNEAWLKPQYLDVLEGCFGYQWCDGMRECIAQLEAATQVPTP